MKDIKIVVTGDICFNMLLWSTAPQEQDGLNWQSQLTLHSRTLPGAALLLADLTALSTGKKVRSPSVPIVCGPQNDLFLRSYIEIGPYPAKVGGKKNKLYRVSQFMGFSGNINERPALLPLSDDTADADLVILDDENNGFSNDVSYWPLAIRETAKKPFILYKLNKPNGETALWQHLDQHHLDRTIVVINADDLRSKGVNISRSLSWEKTALDFVWQLSNNPNLSFLAACRHLIVPFGLEGVIYYKNDTGGAPESFLYFLPYEFENDMMRRNLGKMFGLTSAFVAGLAPSIVDGIAEDDPEDDRSLRISKGIREGLSAARNLFHFGFGKTAEVSQFPNPLMFAHEGVSLLDDVQDVKIPNNLSRDQQDGWYILQGKSSASIAQMAFDMVKNGEENILKSIPTARFGNLKTVDRIEIESYRTIHNLIAEYISSKNTRPLSIAVFGTPGSGKSYGLTEMATSTFPGYIEKVNYNLSQFQSPLELQNAFHRVSDLNLLGKIPLVVFDEFDSFFEGKLGWLKYFLAPMQDGVYMGAESVHPIGKAIFVFTGGTSSTFAEFCGDKIQNEEAKQAFLAEFKTNKGPDFISRLRGYINILGPNQSSDDDQLFMLRRAMLMRSLIERKLPHLINDKGEAQIDNDVLRAMLKIPRYKHEARSVEAIMDMSILTQASKWEQSFLPPKEQLRLHLDETLFLGYMMHDAILSEKIDDIAKLLREKFNALSDAILVPGDDGSLPWKKLDGTQKNFYREQVKSIPDALLPLQYDIFYVDHKTERLAFSEEELCALTKFEYRRRRKYRQAASGKACTLPPEELNKQIYQMVGLWSGVLAECNFKLERLKFVKQYS
ncbi:MAG: Ryanodine receptor Ryr [Oscillospiraceae bacterium]|nr:Ryanodine receptor Ryr [Oscillospiraceae bacterium]